MAPPLSWKAALLLIFTQVRNVHSSPVPACADPSTTPDLATTAQTAQATQASALNTQTFASLDVPIGSALISSGAYLSIQTTTVTVTTFLPVSGQFTSQAAVASGTPGTIGSVLSTLDDNGRSSIQPFNTVLPTRTTEVIQPTSVVMADGNVGAAAAANPSTLSFIFSLVDIQPPPTNIPRRSTHPVPRTGIAASVTEPIDTNKFYANFMLGTQGQPVWTHPYSLQWAKGSGNAKSWGMAISHTERSQLAYAPGSAPVQYFLNPIGIQSVIMSAKELTSSTTLTLDTMRSLSVNANLGLPGSSTPLITFPLTQGMGFVTGVYKSATPMIQSSVFFRTFTGPSALGSTYKYTVTLEDGKQWLIYVTPTTASLGGKLTLNSNSVIMGTAGWSGIIQIAKNPAGSSGEAVYDKSAGVYATRNSLAGNANGKVGTYTFTWVRAGLLYRTLLMFALPHHLASFDSGTAGAKTVLQLQTTTKGLAVGILYNKWTMVESNMPVDMDFAPWTPSKGSIKTVSSAAKAAINNAAASELAQDFNAQTNLDSMYFSGKGLAKFAFIIYAARDLGGNTGQAAAGLIKLKNAFAVFVNNQQTNPLVYDQVWKGIVSSAGYADSGADFGNTYFNDHHFHYGYFVYTAAVIAYLDPSWLTTGGSKQWVQSLVKDFANPLLTAYYPQSRSFDWYHGHSWAKGLYESGDGKDEESSSEDVFASYAIKMWGKVIGDRNMEARGNLMLSIQARSLPAYFLMDSSNQNQPANFIGNKVTGILFENKCDHATYFGMNPEYIQGIHMIPLAPPSTLVRQTKFVQEEWDYYFSNGRVNSIAGGWRGILYANYAIINPSAAYSFFSQANFDNSWLDGGASKTWYLAWSAALGGL